MESWHVTMKMMSIEQMIIKYSRQSRVCRSKSCRSHNSLPYHIHTFLLCDYHYCWNLSQDMAHFKRVTSNTPKPGTTNAVIMGRKTWESIPSKFRPLPGRTNIILNRNKTKSEEINSSNSNPNVLVASSLKEATTKLSALENVGNIFVIGGSQVYEDALQSGFLNRVI